MKKPRPLRLSNGNKLQVCDAIDGDYPLRPHIWGEIDYLTHEDLPAFVKWFNDASRWLHCKKKQAQKKKKKPPEAEAALYLEGCDGSDDPLF